jgi:hypothetical protein
VELLLNVNEEMRLTKVKFWKALETNPLCDPNHINLNIATQLTGEKKLKSWWEKPGFVAWFSEGEEYETKVSAGKFSAIDTLLDVMTNPDAPASARVTAAKYMIDHAKQLEKDDPALEKVLDKIAGVNNVEDLQKFLK